MKNSILIFILFLFSQSLFSQENKLEEKIKNDIQYNEESFFSFDIRKLPNNPLLSVAVVTKYNGEHNSDGFECDLILLLIDNQTKKIIYKLIDDTKFGSDAFMLTSVTLDVANYSVSDTFRAFGVRSNYEGSSRVNPASDENIMLFIIRNNKIEKIMNNYEMKHFIGENDARCNYDNEESESIFIMQKEKTNGFFNILIKNKITKTKSIASKNDEIDCIETIKKLKPTYKTLIYKNGKFSSKK